ncbi:hypothetical protein CAP35_06535 [Chitinophagaceae bacterium IBVUCB1]|nr:hypothetical protein CAP35_06535 [Chitinophagaceae bacterium IBVUCB1]
MAIGRKQKNFVNKAGVIYGAQGNYFLNIITKISEHVVSDCDNTGLIDIIFNERRKLDKKVVRLIPISDTNVPFVIPKDWAWVRLGDVIQYTDNLAIENVYPKDKVINYVDIDSIDNTEFKIREVKPTIVGKLSSRARRVLKKDYLLYSLVRPYLNNIAIVEEECEDMIGSTGFAVFKPIGIDIEYVKLWMLSGFVRDYFNQFLSGFNSPSITIQQFQSLPIPISPNHIQKEIVRFVKSVVSQNDVVIDEAIIPQSVQNEILELRNNQLRLFEIETIIDSKRSISFQLRQSILQEAIQGKLTEEWREENPDVEPASDLLKRIKAEKEQLIKAKKIKKEKPLPPINKDEIPFYLPKGWVWSILDDVALFKNGKAHEQFIDPNGEYVLINSKFVSTNGDVRKHTNELLLPMFKDEIAIVMSDVPNGRALSRCFLVDKNNIYSLNQRIGGIAGLTGINPKYLLIVLDRNQHYLNFDDGKKQTNLTKNEILTCPIPLPPIEEQQAIVEKVESLLKKCNELNNEIDNLYRHSNNLLKAVFNETFSVQA